MSNITTHDIEADGQTYIMEWTRDEEKGGHIAITSTCDDRECDWFINTAKNPSWCCNTHMFDGTGDYPATESHPEVCDFSEIDENGDCRGEHETYDYTEYMSEAHSQAVLARNNIAKELSRAMKDFETPRYAYLREQLKTIEVYTGNISEPGVESAWMEV